MGFPRLRTANCGPRAVAILAGAILLVAGCDRGESGGEPPATGNATTTAPAPIGSTSADSDPLARAQADLRAVQSDYYEAYLAAAADPKDANAVDRLLGLYQDGSPGQRDARDRMKQLADNGFAARPGPDGYFIVQSVEVTSVSDGATARVNVCSYYDGVTYDTEHDGPDGKPITVNDTAESGRTRFRYVNQTGVWKLVGGDVLKTWTGENRCPAK